ncbi:MAG: hypothetical protein JF588_05365 [Caulobacterales bacterium]|nr:hypothetical protein [Caulobacterales bacterium]
MTPFRTLVALAALVLGLLAGPAAQAADWRDQGARSLVMTYRVAPADRLGFRAAVRTGTLPRLAKLKAAGELAGYHVLANRYVDAGGWDVMMILDFASPAALAHWRAVEDAAPAGLTPAALKLVGKVESAPSDEMFEKAAAAKAGDPRPVYLVVPYDYLVGVDDYLAYVKGYLVPQTDGWIEAGALASYGVYLPRYPAGRDWSALLVLAYRGDEGLARRDAVTKAVRGRLAASSPEWKAFADNKQTIRTEKQPVLADELLP